MDERQKESWMKNLVPVECTNLRSQLALSPEPLKGTWDFTNGTKVPYAVTFCRDSARAYALAMMFAELHRAGLQSAAAAKRFNPVFLKEAGTFAPLLFAAAINCANATFNTDPVRADEWRAKCVELIALADGMMSERPNHPSNKATQEDRENRALSRSIAADTVFNAKETLTRDRTLKLGNIAIAQAAIDQASAAKRAN